MARSELSNTKKNLFRIILLLTPIIILLLIEVGLRLINYGGDLDLFVLNDSGKNQEYIFNENFTNRYFFQKGIKTPTPLSQSFSAEKSEDTYRIFCLGASTTQGFPYPQNASYPAYIKNILSDIHPKYNIEVINCGITAITSHSVLDMEKEIIENYEPDLIVVYTGHNEFYGVLGQGSRLSLFENRTLLKAFLKLQKSRLFLLVRDITNSIFGKDYSDNPEIGHNTFMELVAEERNIELNSDLFKITEQHFKDNINEIIDHANEANVDILLCNLVSNKKDLIPFASSKKESMGDELQNKIASANILMNQNNFIESEKILLSALLLDSTNAHTNYKLAQMYEAVGDYNKARNYYNLASDYDVIRFRAPSSFNSIIEDSKNKLSLPIVNIENSFLNESPNRIIGNELLLEHVHPNQDGILIIAKEIVNTMAKNKLIDNDWQLLANVSNTDYKQKANLTLLSKEVINYMLFKLTSTWPYPQNKNSYIIIGNERTEELAKSLIMDENGSLVELHIKYGEELHKAKKYFEALNEYKAALAINPLNIIYNKIGRMYLALTEISYRSSKDFKKANEYFSDCEHYLKKGIDNSPNDIEMNFNLGLLYFMRNDRLDESVEQYKKVLSIDPKHKKAIGKLSELYFRQKKLDKAKLVLEEAIKMYPDNARYYTDLGLILYEEKNIKSAKEYLNKAIAMNNDLKAKYFLQKINNNSL